MKHQQQGRNECYLASIAMLLDMPLAELKQQMGLTTLWGRFKMDILWSTASKDKWDAVSSLIGISYTAELKPAFIKRLYDPGSDIDKNLLDFTGRGLLVVKVHDLAVHAIAYENGLIYDPDHTESETWEAYCIRRPTHVLLTNTKVTLPNIKG